MKSLTSTQKSLLQKILNTASITDIWLEEATEATKEDYNQLDLRLRAKVDNLQFFLSFNPISKANWVFGYYFGDNPPADTLILKTTYKDNAFLPESYVQTLEAMRESNPTYYRIYAEGEFASLDKLIYQNWIRQEFDWRTVPGVLCCGLDFGYTNDASALISSKIDEASKTIWIWLEVYKTGLFNDEIANIIKYHGLQKEIWIGDSAEAKSIDELRLKYGIARIRPATKGQGSVNAGIALLQSYKLIVHPSCENTIMELQNYAWKKDKQTGEYINEPIDKYNHAMDALRYSLQVLDNQQRLTSMPKKLLGL